MDESRPKPPRIGMSGGTIEHDDEDLLTRFMDGLFIPYVAPFVMGGALTLIVVGVAAFCFLLARDIWQDRDYVAAGMVVLFIGGGLAALLIRWRASIK